MQKLAFDIGCNIGKYSNKLLEKGWDVIAVDPNLR
jgi:2-polyprenyl-3-methyl-5-hydroxy-6-metoxy-1,4-benzoquinol methylase